MSKPVRVQLKRTKGWKMPPNTVKVDRSTKWGNPFTASGCREAGYYGSDAAINARCVDAFSVWLGPSWRCNWDGPASEAARALILSDIAKLRGKNLACWCKPGDPCHADVLLEIANSGEQS
ncbi:hypothetical protein APY04_0777 [Hyphomicrobium sulfonivorans]|uniref:DUF4326 domain-containing protein n=1 Tax=Hyphomicrobium sulfonivorans TaxID=121290 RepID=A0A109BKX4_HYPSL|nr:DUF4326 domain-containing protein [Hyphomicrobium sulfonivorans]KWT70716.1 hypothetical protein APY04_0777 [Hyphomicrobium sulfonivorans]